MGRARRAGPGPALAVSTNVGIAPSENLLALTTSRPSPGPLSPAPLIGPSTTLRTVSTNSDKYRKAIAGFSTVVGSVQDWSAASPCQGWTARDVVGHVIGGVQVISGVQTGKAPQRGDPAANAGEDAAGAFTRERDLAFGALTEDNLAKKVQGPMGEMPLDQMIGMFLTPDVLIHTWDLGRAAGVAVELDPQLVEETYNALLPIDAMVRSPGVFGPKVEPPADADAQTKLICFVGRAP